MRYRFTRRFFWPLLPLTLAWLLFAPRACWAEEGYFDSDGVRIHYTVEGQGEPVLLIHGFAGSIYVQWTMPGVTETLAKDYQVIALDNRGHGRSGKPRDPEQYGVHMVDDAVRLLDHLNVERAHVVGYSMGGFIAINLSTLHPERCLSAVIGGAGWPKKGDERTAVLDEVADSLDRGDGIVPLLKYFTPPGYPPIPEMRLMLLTQGLKLTNDVKALAAAARGMKQLTLEAADLEANHVPTLALIGDLDPLKPLSDELAVPMKQLEIVVIPQADHMGACFRPEFVTGIHEFLGQHKGIGEDGETVPPKPKSAPAQTSP